MNLKTGLEQDPFAFTIVSFGGITIVCFAIGFGLSKLRRLRRIGLSQSHQNQVRSGSQMRFYGRTHQLKDGILDWDGPIGKSRSRSKGWGKCKN